MRTAIYPGSFDPITNGHVDIVKRAAHLFDRVVVTVAVNTTKRPVFTLDERVAMVKEALAGATGVEVTAFEGLLVESARQHKAAALVRGLRAVSDFEYEFQIALMNRKLAGEIETVFLMPSEKFTYLSSSLIRELAQMKADVSEFVPPCVVRELRAKFG